MTGTMRRVPTYYQDLVEIVAANPGHVIGSTACLGGFLPTKLLQYKNIDIEEKEEFYIKIKNWLKQMENIFGKNNFYLEMQPSFNKDQIFVNKQIYLLSKELDIPFIITTDSHYLKLEDASIHEAFLNSQDGDREVASFYATTYLMGTDEIEKYFIDYADEILLQEAYQNILKIKDMCEDYSLKKALKIPSLTWKEPETLITSEDYKFFFNVIPYLETFFNSPFNGDRHMVDLIIDKLKREDKLCYKEIYDELNDNLRITWESSNVNKAHWSAYFLNLQQILEECWAAGTLIGAGRGSGVGFLLLYVLDIIQINLKWETTKLFSWRFLNPERVSVLDIDIDIESGKRGKVLKQLRKAYGEDRVANVVTFGTEGSKSAIQTAARGLGIDNDISLYISSLIPADRGKVRTLKQCYYGDVENGFKPIPAFIEAMREYPEIWEVAQKIEGAVCRVGEHAGGVIFVDEPFTNSTALMKVPNEDIVTQFDLGDCEACSLIKMDLLSVEALDKIHACLDLLHEYGYIEKQKTLKETYYKYLDIYSLERDNAEMWDMVQTHKIQSLFQMEKQSGIQGIALTKPKSVDDLAVLNSVIRLMAQNKDEEQPLNKYARFKKNPKLWYAEMDKYGLTKEEQKLLEPIIGQSYGIAESQEKIMQLVQIPECGGFSLNWADSLRKAVAKKHPEAYLKLQEEFFAVCTEKNLSHNLCNYVWNVLIAMSRGYSFNASHTLAYSMLALQEMNLAYKYPLIFWDCACLITDSGGEESVELEKKKSKSTDYKKIATAIGKMKQAGVTVEPPNINTSSYTFTPDVNNNKIVFGLSGILNVGEDVIQNTINNRPYHSPKDYLNKVKPKRQAMISLIKGGAFDSMIDRKTCMAWYIWETCNKKKRITLQNLPGLIKYGLLPENSEETIMARKVYEFNRYLKTVCKSIAQSYILDERAIDFLTKNNYDNLITSFGDSNFYLNIKIWDKKVYQEWMNVFRAWIAENHDEILNSLNTKIFKEEWDKYAFGTISAWEMEALCFYYHDHELKEVNFGKYGIINFFDLSEDPIIDKSFQRGGRTINIFKLQKICGTCIAKDKNKSMVSLLTPEGVVNIKFRKEYFSLFDRQISVRQEDGTKKVVEKSWFNRGSMILIQGIRSGDSFIPKKYASSSSHQLYKINQIMPNGDLMLQSERLKGELEEEDNV